MLASRHHDLVLHHSARTLAELARRDVIEDPSRKEPAFEELAEHDQRSLVLAGRLVLGAAIELTASEHQERRTRGPGARARRKGLPKAWVFELRRDVRVDVRAPIRAFVEGRSGDSPTVQTLVRGHWEQQPHGPGSQLRKLVHVEPYWRGPEAAPIGVRAHRMREL